MTRRDVALGQIAFARDYARGLIDSVPEADWFRIPPAGVSHVAWQVGHLAVAQYRICLLRCRGPRPDDDALIPAAYVTTLFGVNTAADPDPAKYPPVADIRSVLDRVYARVREEITAVPEPDLDLPPLPTHPLCKTRMECLFWAAAHEMLHAGQIGLLRRQLGHKPLW